MTAGGSYVWDPIVVKSHTEQQIDGNTVITIELNEDLLFSDGTPVKAENYLAYLLAFSSPVASAAGAASDAGYAFVGYEEFASYNGTNEGKPALFIDKNGKETKVTSSKSFSGIRLLGDYSFSLTVSSEKSSSYYAYINACLSPYVIEHILGTDVTVKDSGSGVYLDGPWYDRKNGVYLKASHLGNARRDLASYAFSGPYTISEWNPERSECALTINPSYKGNYEGVKPSIETLVYTTLAEGSQLNALLSGAVDIISGITGNSGADAALDAVRHSGGSLAATYYLDASCKKLSLNCDFGPTSFLSVRKALAYALDSEQISKDISGGYGSALYAPYSAELDMWKQRGNEIELTEYLHSLENAKKALVEGGWIYNADGSKYEEKAGGVRYKKLTAEESEAYEGANLSYSVISSDGNTEYKTELVDEEFYLPCAISWLGLDKDEFTSLVSQKLIEEKLASSLGIAISLTLADSSAPDSRSAYGMCSTEQSWNFAIYETCGGSYDPYDSLFPYGEGGLTLSDAQELSGGKLGIDYLSRAMIADSSSPEEYSEWWGEYLERWNALIPDIALCSAYQFDLYNSKIKGLDTSPFRSVPEAIVYCSVE
jgi:peptide/nickel transport system substrate-binding protein